MNSSLDHLTTNDHDRLVLHTRVVTGSGGGPDKTILNSPRFLRERGYPMICAYMRPPGDPYFAALERRADGWNAPLVAVDDRGPFDTGVITQFQELCRRHRPAIWHGHDYKSNLIGLWLRRSFPMKLVTTVHGWVKHTWKTPLYYSIDKFCLARYHSVICVSEDLYDACRARGVDSNKLHFVPNAIDTQEYRRREPSALEQRRRGVPEGRLVIGAVGRLSEEKGFHLLIEAVSRLLKKGFDVELWIAGEGDQQDRLERLIDEQNQRDRIKLLGFQSDTISLFHAMDLFVLSSIREGLPNVVLEAMALDVPVVSTNVAGVPAVLTHDVNGWIIEPGSAPAIESALEIVLRDSNRRKRLGQQGRETIEERYSFQRRMDRIKEIYDRLFSSEEGS